MVVIDRVYAGGAVQAVVQGTMTPTVPGVGGTFVVDDATGYPVTGKFPVKLNRTFSDQEHILVDSRVGTTFTVGQRGYDGTNAQSHDHPTCEIYFDAQSANLIVAHVDDLEVDPHATKLLNNTRHDVTARHTYGAALGTRPVPVAVGTVLGAGSGSVAAAGDHVHELGVGSIDAANLFVAGIIDAAAIGTDQVGTLEIAPDAVTAAEIATGAVGVTEINAAVYGASATTVALANGAGAATTVSRSDHVHSDRAFSHLATVVRRTADQTGLGPSMVDFTGMAITGTVAASRYIRVRVHAYIQGDDGGANYSGVIREGSTTLGKFGWFRTSAAFESAVLEGSVLLTAPSGGAHTYKASMESSGGSTFAHLAATDEGRIEIIDEGPVV